MTTKNTPRPRLPARPVYKVLKVLTATHDAAVKLAAMRRQTIAVTVDVVLSKALQDAEIEARAARD